jgi:hypothetical protein
MTEFYIFCYNYYVYIPFCQHFFWFELYNKAYIMLELVAQMCKKAIRVCFKPHCPSCCWSLNFFCLAAAVSTPYSLLPIVSEWDSVCQETEDTYSVPRLEPSSRVELLSDFVGDEQVS